MTNASIQNAGELIAMLDARDKETVTGMPGSLSPRVFIGSAFEWKRKGRWEAPRAAGGAYVIQLLDDRPADESGWRAWVERASSPVQAPPAPYGTAAVEAAEEFADALASRARAHKRVLLIGGGIVVAVVIALALASGKG